MCISYLARHALGAAAIALSPLAAADIHHVPGNHSTIQEAINACQDGDEVVVADGIWTGPGNRDLAFADRLITVRSESGNPATCVIDCQSLGRGFYIVNQETAQATIEDFTIRNGWSFDDGGAIYIDDSSPTFRNCVIEDSFAEFDGGGAYINGGLASFENCTFQGCSAFNDGGAIYGYEGGASPITGCTFEGNWAFGRGGALFSVVDWHVMITQTTFTDNWAADSGGAIFNGAAEITIDDCTFTGNEATGPAPLGSGGAIYNTAATMTLTDCGLELNSASLHGGGLCNDSGEATLTGCTLTGNWTTFYSIDGPPPGGGAIANLNYSTLTATDCTIANNTAPRAGGGILNLTESTADLTGMTVRDNESEYGGGIANVANFGHTTVIRDSRFETNTATFRGGGMFSQTGTYLISRCEFVNNDSPSGGGGTASIGSDIVLASCVYVGNSANTGGAVLTELGPRTLLTNCTLFGNTATSGGSAVSVFQIADDFRMVNCTLWANSGGSGAFDGQEFPSFGYIDNCILWGNDPGPFGYYMDSVTVRYSDVEGGWSGPDAVGNIDADPLFFHDDGPDGMPGTEDDDLRLTAFSPCIDAADNTQVPADETDLDGDANTTEPLPLDLADLPRFDDNPAKDDTGVGPPPVVDMGAYEWQLPETCPWDCAGDFNGIVNVVDFLALLAQWGTPGYCDFDGGGVSVTDFLLLLGHWGPCP